MKTLQTLIFSILIIAALFWQVPAQVPADATAANQKLTSTPAQTGVAPQNPSVAPNNSVDLFVSISLGVATASLLLVFWHKVGADNGGISSETSFHVLTDLIKEVEESSGYSRNDARAKAKAWLQENVTSLGESEIFLAKTHFSYLLPAGWGVKELEA